LELSGQSDLRTIDNLCLSKEDVLLFSSSLMKRVCVIVMHKHFERVSSLPILKSISLFYGIF
jgi:hypothetical protein